MKLKIELEKINQEFVSKVPSDILMTIKNHVERLAQEEVGKNALKTGDTVPNFKLRNAFGAEVALYDLLKEGPVVISFYRGSWCPYCNLELQAYQEVLPDIHNLSAQLVAISPELPDGSLTLVEKYALTYEVLTDQDNLIAKHFGLAFTVEPALQEAYTALGIDLVKSQGNTHFELPIPATYIVDVSGYIVEAFINSDFTKRLEPEEVIELLRKMT